METCYYCDGDYKKKDSTANEYKNMFCSVTCEERWDGEFIKKD